MKMGNDTSKRQSVLSNQINDQTDAYFKNPVTASSGFRCLIMDMSDLKIINLTLGLGRASLISVGSLSSRPLLNCSTKVFNSFQLLVPPKRELGTYLMRSLAVPTASMWVSHPSKAFSAGQGMSLGAIERQLIPRELFCLL